MWFAYQAAEHSFKNDSKVNDFEGFGDAAKACKQNKDLFLRECLQLLKSAVPEGKLAQFHFFVVLGDSLLCTIATRLRIQSTYCNGKRCSIFVSDSYM